MHFKLIVAFVEDTKTEHIMQAAREAGATGATVINHARGEGLQEPKTFFGLTLSTQRDIFSNASGKSASSTTNPVRESPSSLTLRTRSGSCTRRRNSEESWRRTYDQPKMGPCA